MGAAHRLECGVVVLAGGGRLRAFQRSGKPLPFLPESARASLLRTISASVRGPVWVIEGQRVLPAGATAHRRLLIVDASAPFIEAATLNALVRELAHTDIARIRENDAAIAITGGLLSLLTGRSGKPTAVELGKLLREAGTPTPAGTIQGTVGVFQEHERRLSSPEEVFRAFKQRKLNRAMGLIGRGLGLRDPEGFELRGTLVFGSGVSIGSNVIISGEVTLGDGVTVGPNCILEHARIAAGCTVKEFSTVTDARVGKKCRIGPYARIRPSTVIGAGCQIGNFVEIKNSRLGPNCKINHHAFVGDGTIGKNVVIGAGSVTCNFDGRRTNRTVIRDHAFIGSGVMLIAPVRIGRNAVIGAGSAVTKNAPANSLTLSRARQTSIEDWVRIRKNR